MNEEEWKSSNSAPDMLAALRSLSPVYLKSLVPTLHQYFIACCWKHQHLIPQKGLRNGLLGAQNWIEGKIDDDELYRLNWHAEADCFFLDYAKTEEELDEIKDMIYQIEELEGMSFEAARKRLLKVAYFAEISMIYTKMRGLPYIRSLFTSEFLCADLLREYVKPDFPL